MTTVGVIASVTAFLRVPGDQDRLRGDRRVRLGPRRRSTSPSDPPCSASCRHPAGRRSDGSEVPDERRLILKENLRLVSAPRRILGELIPSLNGRLTGSGSVVGDPALMAGRVVQLEGLGREFGGRYRITSATHTIDSSGYRTSFEARKEIWFGSIPALDQGAVALQAPFVDVAVGGGRMSLLPEFAGRSEHAPGSSSPSRSPR